MVRKDYVVLRTSIRAESAVRAVTPLAFRWRSLGFAVNREVRACVIASVALASDVAGRGRGLAAPSDSLALLSRVPLAPKLHGASDRLPSTRRSLLTMGATGDSM